MCHVRLRVVGAVLVLDVHPEAELLQIEAAPVDPDLVAHSLGFVARGSARLCHWAASYVRFHGDSSAASFCARGSRTLGRSLILKEGGGGRAPGIMSQRLSTSQVATPSQNVLRVPTGRVRTATRRAAPSCGFVSDWKPGAERDFLSAGGSRVPSSASTVARPTRPEPRPGRHRRCRRRVPTAGAARSHTEPDGDTRRLRVLCGIGQGLRGDGVGATSTGSEMRCCVRTPS